MTKVEYFETGAKHGLVVGGITFLGAWIYCTATYGFLLGFGLGWIASGILGAIIFFIVRLIWLPIDLMAVIGILYAAHQPSNSAVIAPYVPQTTGYQSPAPPAQILTMSLLEQERLKNQVTGCWDVPTDIVIADQMPVEVILQINPDRTVRDSRVVDQTRMTTDRNFREVAQSALQALKNPKCKQLELPPEKYSQWSTIDFTFDPRNIPIN